MQHMVDVGAGGRLGSAQIGFPALRRYRQVAPGTRATVLSRVRTRAPALWCNPGLRNLIIAFGLVNMAEWGFTAALSVYAFEIDGTFAVGLLGIRMLAGAISAAIIAPRVEEVRGVLAAISVGRMLLLVSAATLAVAGVGFGVVLTVVVMDAIVAAGYRPSHQRLLPALAKSPSELMQAVAGTSASKTVGQAVGAVIGGLAVGWISPAKVMLFLALLMAGPLLCSLSVIRVVGTRRAAAQPPFRTVLAAFPSVLRDSQAWPLVSASVLRTMVRGVWSALLVVVALRLLEVGNAGVGLLQAAAGLGAVLAIPITAAQIGLRRLAPSCRIAFSFAGLAIAGVGETHVAAAGLALICIWGLAMSVADATSMSLLHRLFHPDALSRAVGVMESLKLVSEGTGALLAPALVSLFGLGTTLVITGVSLPALVALTWGRLRVIDALAEGRGHLVTRLHKVTLFSSLNMERIEEVAASVVPIDVEPGTNIITQGRDGDSVYVIDSGECEVLIDNHAIGRIGPGRAFGERALLRDTRRSATVRALAPTHLYTVERNRFLAVVTGSKTYEPNVGGESIRPPDREYQTMPLEDLLSELTPLTGIDRAGLATLASLANRRQHAPNEIIFREGDRSDAIHIILEGRAEVSTADQVIAVLLPGDCFGEIGLLHQKPRTASVKALERLHLVSLPTASVLEAIEAGGNTPTHHLLSHADSV
jgi:CRP-like cAMP-binding protein/predicted MFS family arabinose efflux permease